MICYLVLDFCAVLHDGRRMRRMERRRRMIRRRWPLGRWLVLAVMVLC